MSCASCDDPIGVYLRSDALGVDVAHHAYLYRCDDCGTLYEVFPELKAIPQPIDRAAAAARFPDADL